MKIGVVGSHRVIGEKARARGGTRTGVPSIANTCRLGTGRESLSHLQSTHSSPSCQGKSPAEVPRSLRSDSGHGAATALVSRGQWLAHGDGRKFLLAVGGATSKTRTTPEHLPRAARVIPRSLGKPFLERVRREAVRAEHSGIRCSAPQVGLPITPIGRGRKAIPSPPKSNSPYPAEYPPASTLEFLEILFRSTAIRTALGPAPARHFMAAIPTTPLRHTFTSFPSTRLLSSATTLNGVLTIAGRTPARTPYTAPALVRTARAAFSIRAPGPST